MTDTAEYSEGDNPPAVGRTVGVRLALPSDSFTDLGRWVWERSDNGVSAWVAITNVGASDRSDRYTPVMGDEGMHLRASAPYVDSEGNPMRAVSPIIGPVVILETITDTAEYNEGNDPPVVGQIVGVGIDLPRDSFTNRGRWVWERSDNGVSGWVNITDYELTGGTYRYTPVAADEGKYLRASVSYVDSAGNPMRTVSPVSGPVVAAER